MKEDKLLQLEREKTRDLILVPMVDHYRALPKKLKLAYQWALDNTNAKWMLKIDDDATARLARLEHMLMKLNDQELYVIGHVVTGGGVPKGGKWAELTYNKPNYPSFANGAQGHVVSRAVAREVVAYDGFEYQGEDVSLGIWLDDLKLKVKWINARQHFTAHGNCQDDSKIVIGHNIAPGTMRKCFKRGDGHEQSKQAQASARNKKFLVYHHLMGRLGNQLFQWASIDGISRLNQASPCLSGGDLWSFFDGVGSTCKRPDTGVVLSEGRKYATHHKFSMKESCEIQGYLQSHRYFDKHLRTRLGFKSTLQHQAAVFLRSLTSNMTVGIHVRRYEQPYLREPPPEYFIQAMKMFTEKYDNVQFVVASDSPEWCKSQTFLQRSDVRIITEKHSPALDMAILAACNHMIITLGTFGWWAAYLGPDARGGRVIYYKSEFKMDHHVNSGNVVAHDYYPLNWTAM